LSTTARPLSVNRQTKQELPRLFLETDYIACVPPGRKSIAQRFVLSSSAVFPQENRKVSSKGGISALTPAPSVCCLRLRSGTVSKVEPSRLDYTQHYSYLCPRKGSFPRCALRLDRYACCKKSRNIALRGTTYDPAQRAARMTTSWFTKIGS
jgi:hypothetical protein